MLFIYMLENWKILGQLCQSVSQKGHLSIDVKTREGATHEETTLRVCSHVAALGGYTQRVLCCDNANMLQFTIYNVQILVQLMGISFVLVVKQSLYLMFTTFILLSSATSQEKKLCIVVMLEPKMLSFESFKCVNQ